MSTYFAVQGVVSYKEKADFDNAIKFLEESGYLQNKHIVDECGDEITERDNVDTTHVESSIEIPRFHYRNLGRYLDKIMKNGTGKLIWTSTDGMFEGGVLIDGVETTYDLEEWNAENNGETRPVESDFDGEDKEDDYFENLIEWQSNIENNFFDHFE